MCINTQPRHYAMRIFLTHSLFLALHPVFCIPSSLTGLEHYRPSHRLESYGHESGHTVANIKGNDHRRPSWSCFLQCWVSLHRFRWWTLQLDSDFRREFIFFSHLSSLMPVVFWFMELVFWFHICCIEEDGFMIGFHECLWSRWFLDLIILSV